MEKIEIAQLPYHEVVNCPYCKKNNSLVIDEEIGYARVRCQNCNRGKNYGG
jgi:transposase-like protein